MVNCTQCYMMLPCGHECIYTNETPHWKHKRQKCMKKCSREVCVRKHRCEKRCWETCGPCKHPVKAELACEHEAVLPCSMVDSYQCQELCQKIVCPEGHTCGKECWEDCGPCKVPIALKLSCNHHAIIPCYLNDSSFKCKERCSRKVDCELKHECERECWERCQPCISRVKHTLPCGHEVLLPCHLSPDNYQCHRKCEKVLCKNNHVCRRACWEECGPCKMKIGVTLPCSHKVILPCGTDIGNYVCKQCGT